jgi:hypothetical protein
MSELITPIYPTKEGTRGTTQTAEAIFILLKTTIPTTKFYYLKANLAKIPPSSEDKFLDNILRKKIQTTCPNQNQCIANIVVTTT